MKPVIFLVMICAIFISSYSQQFDIEFQQCYGGSDGEGGADVIMMPDSSFILFGLTTSNDGDISYNHGEGDFWLVKTDKYENLVWEKTYGGSDSELPENMAVTSNGFFILFGETESNNGDVSGNHGGIDYWVVKTDSLGNLLWQRCLGSSVNDLSLQMRLDDEDNIYVIGESHGDDGDITEPCDFIDYWIVKLNTNGDLLWDRTLGGTYIDWGITILPTSDGGYIAGGYTTSTDGDVSCTNPTIMHSDAWIVKLDSLNNIEWNHCYGGSNNETANDIIATEDNGYLIAGSTNSNDGDVSGFHGTPGGEEHDIWVWKIDSIGNLEWQRCLGGTKDEGRAELTYFGDGEYIINGYTDSNDGDVSGNHSIHYGDIWLLKIDNTGDLIWQQCFGSSEGEASSGIYIMNDLEIMVVGGVKKSDGSVECELFHPGLPYDGDMWIFKIFDTVSVYSPEYMIDPTRILMYPNPAEDLIYYFAQPVNSHLSLFVYDIYGRKMGEFELSENQNQIGIDVSKYPEGVYVAVLQNEKSLIRKDKFVVR